MTTINGVEFNMKTLELMGTHRNVPNEQPGSDESFITDMGYTGLVIRMVGYEKTLAKYDEVINEFMKSGAHALVYRTGWQFTVYSVQLVPKLEMGIVDNFFPYELMMLTGTPYRESSSLSCRAKEITANNEEWSAGDIPCENILENWSFEDWTAGTSVAPDNWVDSGLLSVARDAQHKVGTYSAKLYASTGGANLYQSISLDYAGEELTLGCWVYTGNSNDIRIGLVDDTGTTYSNRNSVGGAWEWLTVTKTIDPGTAYIRAGLLYLDAIVYGWFDGAVLVEGDSIPDYLADIDTAGVVDAVPDISILSNHPYPASENQEYDATERNTASTSYVLMSTTTHTGVSEKRSQITEVKAQFGMSGAGVMGYKWTAQAASYLDGAETTIVEDTYPNAGYAYRTHDVSGDDIIAGIGETFTIKLYIKMISGAVSAYEKTNYTTEDITTIYLKDVDVYNTADSTVKASVCNNIINDATVRINVDGTGTYNLVGDLSSSNCYKYDSAKHLGITHDAVNDELDIADDGYVYWKCDTKYPITGIPTLTSRINITAGTPTIQISSDGSTWYDITTAIVDDVETVYNLDNASLSLKGLTEFYWRIDCVKAGAATCSVKSFELDVVFVTIDVEHPKITSNGVSTIRCDQGVDSGMNCVVVLGYRDRSWAA